MSALPPGRRSTRSTAQPLVPSLSNEQAPRKPKPKTKPKRMQPQPKATPKLPPAPPASTNDVVVAERAPSTAPVSPVAPATPASSTPRPAAVHPPAPDAPAFVPPPFAAFKTQFSESMRLSSSEQELCNQLMSSRRAPLVVAMSMFTPDALPVPTSIIGSTTTTAAAAAAMLAVAAGASHPSTADSLPVPQASSGLPPPPPPPFDRQAHYACHRAAIVVRQVKRQLQGRSAPPAPVSSPQSSPAHRHALPPMHSEDAQSGEEELANIPKGGNDGFDDDSSEND
ncbi:hypothetical protein B0H17DRAFT_1203427 [Mycena rosella]|uniref:Uncharacterized protein n=1 Tax=Mycena rosella TaxID=1033263 RepID=A0AAD7DD93_MYCRO|nr:hypothetical protein B0H17DRAFT_1203427 [Mycena rosella]